jgi:hypothetical protein
MIQPLWIVIGISVVGVGFCGSELARDSGFSVNEEVECVALIASKLAPT